MKYNEHHWKLQLGGDAENMGFPEADAQTDVQRERSRQAEPMTKTAKGVCKLEQFKNKANYVFSVQKR